MRCQSEHSYWAPGQGLKGMRLIFAGRPLSSRTSSRASASVSLTPLSMTYSKGMRRAFEAGGVGGGLGGAGGGGGGPGGVLRGVFFFGAPGPVGGGLGSPMAGSPQHRV